MNAKLNADGRFWDRFFPALIAAALGVGGTAIVFYADTRANDRELSTAIQRIDRDIAQLKIEAHADRGKTADLSSDVKVLLAIVSRIEATLLRDGVPPPRTQISPQNR